MKAKLVAMRRCFLYYTLSVYHPSHKAMDDIKRMRLKSSKPALSSFIISYIIYTFIHLFSLTSRRQKSFVAFDEKS